MKVAVGIDGSDIANLAVRFVGRLLSSKVDDLLLYYSPPSIHLDGRTSVPENVLKKATEALAETVFRDAELGLSPEMRTVTDKLHGDKLPAEGLLELVEAHQVDLVVMGSKSAARKFPFLLGSTARTVIHHTGKPVLVVRGEIHPHADPLKVLVACDQNRWIDATGILREFSWPANTTCTLLHVTECYGDQMVEWMTTEGAGDMPYSVALAKEYEESVDHRESLAQQQLEQLQQRGPLVIKNARIEMQRGHVVENIIETVERDNIDLLVLSSRKLSAIGRMLGSVTEALLTQCPCSLLIVHDEPGEETPRVDAVGTTSLSSGSG